MRRITAVFAVAAILLTAHLNASPASAQAAPAAEGPSPRLDTPSGLPVPRFVSLKAEKTNCRTGPSFDHPIRITYMRKGLPVMVVAETSDHWRKIRDSEGDECWAHRTKLSGVETALVLVDGLSLYRRPEISAPLRARLGKGVIGRIETREGDWLRVSANGVKGWAVISGFWGAADIFANAAAQN